MSPVTAYMLARHVACIHWRARSVMHVVTACIPEKECKLKLHFQEF